MASRRLTLVTSSVIWAEYYAQISKPSVRRLLSRHGVRIEEVNSLLTEFIALAELLMPVGEAPPCRDPDDRKYLHLAAFGNVPWLVTRDRDLLDENENVAGTAILPPEAFLEDVEAQGADLEP